MIILLSSIGPTMHAVGRWFAGMDASIKNRESKQCWVWIDSTKMNSDNIFFDTSM